MRSKQNPQIRIRMSPEQQHAIQKLAADTGMDFSEWICDRLSLLTDDDKGTASKIAEMVVALWRIFEVLNNQEIDLQHPLAAKGLRLIADTITATAPSRDNDVKRTAEKLVKMIDTLAGARMERVYSIGKMLRSEKSENNDSGAGASA
jgi:hypothetical protein